LSHKFLKNANFNLTYNSNTNINPNPILRPIVDCNLSVLTSPHPGIKVAVNGFFFEEGG